MSPSLQRYIAFLAIMALTPVWVITALAILLLDGRPLMFNQTRIGKNSRPFQVFKFRTMRNQKVTSVGRWLRATGIDELPQLFNVIKGDMLLVGPRPLTPTDITRLGWNNHYHLKRWNVPPGITGLAQLFAGHSKRMSWAMDNRYLHTRSFKQDLNIMLITFPMQILGKYRVRGWLFGQTRSEKIYGAPTRKTSASIASSNQSFASIPTASANS